MIAQPVLGWMHHRNYVKYQRRTTISHAHIWYGRGMMILGIVNGGLGLQLSGASTGLAIAYAVVGVLVSIIYSWGAVHKMVERRRKEHQLITSDHSNSALELMRA
jgi:sorbitol-specific phosphotransferase system component IIC